MATIAELYAKRMAKMSNLVTEEFKEELEITTFGSDIYQQLKVKVEVATGKKVYDNFTFKSGKVMGLLAAAAYAPKKEAEVCSILGVTPALLELFRKNYGRLPYLDKDNTPVEGVEMNCDIIKDIVLSAATSMNLLIEESDVEDINKERWQHLWDLALEKQKKNQEFNESQKKDIYKED